MAPGDGTRTRRRVLRRLPLALLSCLALLGVGAATASPAQAADPPDVVGRTVAEARAILTADGAGRVVTVPAELPAPEDVAVVVEQRVLPGEPEPTYELRARVAVPSALGLSVAAADTAMSGLGLISCPDHSTGTIARHVMAAGLVVPFGTAVGLGVDRIVGTPDPPVRSVGVPSVLGLSVADAELALQRAGFRSAVHLRTAAAVSPVLDQEPPAGARVGPGALVTVIADAPAAAVAPPAAASRARVPDVVGLEVADAIARLDEQGLVIEVVARQQGVDPDIPGPVLEQVPPADAEVDAGTVVRVVVDALVRVPDLAGLGVAQARELLAELGLTLVIEQDARAAVGNSVLVRQVSAVPLTAPAPSPAPVITEQDPAPGGLAVHGSEVRVRVGPDPGPVGPEDEREGEGPVVPPDREAPFPWWLVLLVLLVLIALAWFAVYRAAPRRWVAEHVAVDGVPSPPVGTVTPAPGAPPSLSVSVVGIPDPERRRPP